MKPCIGSIVKSKAGHDTDVFYVVIKIEDEKYFVVDGKHHKLENPKKKNIIHLAKTNNVVCVKNITTDRKIRRVLWQFNHDTHI